MAELEDLGTPPVFAEIVRVGYAVARLRLPTDNTVPREVAATAEKVDRATMALQGAVDLAVELQDEGVRQPVSLIPPPSTEFDQERAHVWARHAELQASVEEFVGTSVGFPPPMGRATEYRLVMTQAVQALGAMEEQRRLALGGRGPRLPEPPEPTRSPRPREPDLHRDAEGSPRDREPIADDDGPPAASARPVTERTQGLPPRPDTKLAPTMDDLELRLSDVTRNSRDSERQLALGSPATDRAPADVRELG